MPDTDYRRPNNALAAIYLIGIVLVVVAIFMFFFGGAVKDAAMVGWAFPIGGFGVFMLIVGLIISAARGRS